MANRLTEMICLAVVLFVVGGYTVSAQQEPATPDQAEPPSEPQELEFRTWTDSTGKYQVEGAMVKFSGGKAHLQKKDGSTIDVPVGKLSKADQRYIRQELARRAARDKPPKPKPSDVDVPAADWPGWRGALRDGKSPDTGLLKQWPAEGPKKLWQADGIGKGFSNVAVTGGTIYTTGDVGGQLVIFALDTDGKPKWKVPHAPAYSKDKPGSRSTPMIDGGRLYLVGGNGLVGCYDIKNGQRIWGHDMVREFGGGVPNWGYAESVLIYGDLAVVTPGGGNCIVALDKKSGRLVWKSQGFQAGAQYSSCYAFTYQGVPMITNGTREGIVGVDPKSGRMLWSNPFSAGNIANCPTPAFADGYVFWANGYNKGGICLKLATSGGRVAAQEAWTTRDMVCHHGGYIIHEGYI